MGIASQDDELFIFFRKQCINLQSRFGDLVDLRGVPRVFLHGNPHLDNYAKTEFGEAMIDFDRSRFGPYSWDIIRFFTSLAFRKEESENDFLEKTVVEEFQAGYEKAFRDPHQAFPKRRLPLKKKKPKDFETSIHSYLDANKRWAKKMRANPLFPSHPIVRELCTLYFEGRNQHYLTPKIEPLEAGIASGTFGKKRIVILLKIKESKQEPILIDVKEVYKDADHGSFFNPYSHHGLRMIHASHLIAPQAEAGLSHLTWRGNQYWARQIPCFKAKFKKKLSLSQQRDLAYTVGFQLGRAHRMSCYEFPPNTLLDHFRSNVEEFIQVGKQLNKEVLEKFEDMHPSAEFTERSSGQKHSLLERNDEL